MLGALLGSAATAQNHSSGAAPAPLSGEKGRVIAIGAALDEVQRGQAMLIDTRRPFERRKIFAAGTCAAIPYIMTGEYDDDYVEDVLTAVKGDRHAPIILISRYGMRARKAQDVLEANGFTDVRAVEGGFEALWEREAAGAQ